MSNPKMFKYELIWNKGRGFEPQLAKIRPQKAHENLVIFADGKTTYNPQMEERDAPTTRNALVGNRPRNNRDSNGHNFLASPSQNAVYTHRYPISVQLFANAGQSVKVHPTQKPVALMEYLIKTYTNENEKILDFTMGSGTAGAAAIRTKRKFVGIEMDDKYFEVAKNRIEGEIASC